MNLVKKTTMMLALVALAGCSSIIYKSTQNVTIKSNPPGAILQIDGQRYMTPAVVPLKGKSEYYFTMDAPGYQTTSGKVDGEFRVWSAVVGNLFNLTGFVGFAIDFWGSQTAFEMQKDNTVTLIPMQAAAAPEPAAQPAAATQLYGYPVVAPQAAPAQPQPVQPQQPQPQLDYQRP